jgi:hypothetical protein
MDLIILVLIFAVLGYFLGVSRFGKQVDRATEQLTLTTGKVADNLEGRWKSFIKRPQPGEFFRNWVASAGASLFPDEFKAWLKSLSSQEAREFTSALGEYSNSLGFSLNKLVDGGLDQEPILRQVFVEAVVVYSSAYRKAKTALQQSEAKEAKKAPLLEGEAKPAEKSASRRVVGSQPEANEAASAAA